MDLKAFLSSKYDSDTFESFIKERFYGLDIYDSGNTDNFLSESEKKSIDAYRFLGKVELEDGKEIGFFEFKSKSIHIENKRVGYNAILKKLAYEEYLDGAIASFYHPDGDVWRLSFVGFEYDEGKASVTNLKRFTYVLGEGIPTKTPLAQLKDLKYPKINEIEKAFSVEALNDRFFKDYKMLFEEINTYLINNKYTNFNSDAEDVRAFSKKLLGRITFLYFLQKKGWLGVNETWGDGDKNFLQKTFQNIPKDKNFYELYLKNIFFEALNLKRPNDNFKLLNCKIPFLNGGLFECKNTDKEILFIENNIFENIFEIFSHYNFTIIEDLPHDSEVAIDPEMLGKVFENLLEDNYQSSKGAFYTPREIVHYMCKQSIYEYMINDFIDNKEAIYNLIFKDISDDDFFKNSKNAIAVENKIKSIKILDPAIGSGAFPMGLLSEIIGVLQNLNKTIDTVQAKIDIIENSIYGIDIDASAVEIAKLRFWLSIVVDEDEPKPLPNLDFKIMQGNSLLETINGFDPLEENEQNKGNGARLKRMKKKFHDFYNASSKEEKSIVLKSIEKDVNEIFTTALRKRQIKRQKNLDVNNDLFTTNSKLLKEIEEQKQEIELIDKVLSDYQKTKSTNELFLYKIYFAEVLDNGGFDIVIGNPPYLRVQGIDKKVSEQYKNIFDSATGSYDLYVLFAEQGLSLLSNEGVLNFIMPHKWVNASFGKGLRELSRNTIHKLISFDAYQVFNASTYTSLVWFKNKKDDSYLKYVELNKDLYTNKELENYLFGLKDDEFTNINNNDLTSESWILTNKQTYEILEKLKKQPLRMNNIFEKIFTGLQTNKDSIYFLKNCRYEDDLIIAFSDELQKEIRIEQGLVKPLLKGDDIHRYEKITTDKVVIFPYYIEKKDDKDKAILYTEDEISMKFPNGYKYLKECESILRDREKGRLRNDDYWFRYIYPKNLTRFDKEKLIQPDISMGGNFAYDENGKFYQTTTLYGYEKCSNIQESYKFFMAILNSKLLWWYLTQTGTTLANGYFRFKPDYLNPFPMPKINNIEDTEPFEVLVDYIMWLKSHKNDPINKYVDNEHIAKEFESVIDAMVYELYFKEEFQEKGLEFISFAKRDFESIANITDVKKISETIHKGYQVLRERENEIRNNTQLMKVRLSDIILPIERSI
ncbi:hypothetical protein TSL6_02170 [Sulfurovum sp. TSL6]|uniref:Eco57I restriction-modification methylase domain-containing protein n=1 Tax=Sulfurovum sp. TSL6 TaxID=2826995 RepID=UPI001CC7C79C|nr:TaqI-like C-terminal specificity domain-containing protein [Sulfurovum sp. TSL6]GIT99710.1 hypothetical protein TSL6_02170 [Sulfurovum sp. TSL6]